MRSTRPARERLSVLVFGSQLSPPPAAAAVLLVLLFPGFDLGQILALLWAPFSQLRTQGTTSPPSLWGEMPKRARERSGLSDVQCHFFRSFWPFKNFSSLTLSVSFTAGSYYKPRTLNQSLKDREGTGHRLCPSARPCKCETREACWRQWPPGRQDVRIRLSPSLLFLQACALARTRTLAVPRVHIHVAKLFEKAHGKWN